ncbi:hypothetical protein Agub_g784, partial [Astrephomene gubernaculifera]
LRVAVQRRLDKSLTQLKGMVAAVKKSADADAAAAGTSAAGAASSDEESAEPSAAAAAAGGGVLEPKLRSYLNLYRKLYPVEEEEAVLGELATQSGVDVAVLRRAASQGRPGGQRKRPAGSKAAAAVATSDEVLRQQASSIAAEVQRGLTAGVPGAGGGGAAPAGAGRGAGG